MADRENVKIVISAALIVVVASMGIYAFIYRDKISQMLPNWQTKGKTERMITEESSDPNSPLPIPRGMEPSDEDKEYLGYKTDPETKNYPEIPQNKELDSSSKQDSISKFTGTDSKTDTKNPANKIIESYPKETTGIYDSPKKSDSDTTGMKTNTVDVRKETTKTTEYKPSVDKNWTEKKTTTKTTVDKKLTSDKKKFSDKKQSNNTKQTSVTKNTTKTTYPKSTTVVKNTTTKQTTTTSKESTSSSNMNERIKNLESKLNVHMQDTGKRLDSIERRLDKLERQLETR